MSKFRPLGMAVLAAASLLALSGCAAVELKLGTRVSLAKIPVASIEASQPKGPGIGPGQKSPLVVTVTEPDGKVLKTEGAGKGKVMWRDLAVTPTVVTVEASVIAAGHHRYYLIDPNGGSLSVKADGGPGGSGGRGGRGGSGGSGGIGSPNGSDGRSGSDGRNGSDGSPGRGGLITVNYDPKVKPYLAEILTSSLNGPKPVFNEVPVAPLW